MEQVPVAGDHLDRIPCGASADLRATARQAIAAINRGVLAYRGVA